MAKQAYATQLPSDYVPIEFVIDQNMRYVWTNSAFSEGRNLLLSAGEIIGRSMCDIYPLRIAEYYERVNSTALAAGRDSEAIVYVQQKKIELPHLCRFRVIDAGQEKFLFTTAYDVRRITNHALPLLSSSSWKGKELTDVHPPERSGLHPFGDLCRRSDVLAQS